MASCRTYNKRVSVQQLSGTADAFGHIDPADSNNWSEHAPGFADVQSKGGREFWKVDQVAADVSHVWWCPYSAALAQATTDMRLVCEGVNYEILSVIDVDLAHEEVEIQTKLAT